MTLTLEERAEVRKCGASFFATMGLAAFASVVVPDILADIRKFKVESDAIAAELSVAERAVAEYKAEEQGVPVEEIISHALETGEGFIQHIPRENMEEHTDPPPYAWLQLEGMDNYNALTPFIDYMAFESGIPAETIATIVLTETRGIAQPRYEHDFRETYIDPLFEKEDGGLPPNQYTHLFKKLQADNPTMSKEQFKKQLATSVGPMQILYCTAIDLGFEGTLAELSDSETNIRWGTEFLVRERLPDPKNIVDALKVYNTGRIDGTPTEGYLRRGMDFYWKIMEKPEVTTSD